MWSSCRSCDMTVELINAMAGLLGVSTGLIATWWALTEHRPRPTLHVSYSEWLEGQKAVRGWKIVVVNRGRMPLLLQSIGVYGLAIENDPIGKLKKMNEEHAKLPRRIRWIIRRQQPSPNPAGDAIIIQPRDAREVRMALDLSPELHKVSGRWWGVFAEERTGKMWRLNGDAINRGERRLPRWLLAKSPDWLRLTRHRYKQIEVF